MVAFGNVVPWPWDRRAEPCGLLTPQVGRVTGGAAEPLDFLACVPSGLDGRTWVHIWDRHRCVRQPPTRAHQQGLGPREHLRELTPLPKITESYGKTVETGLRTDRGMQPPCEMRDVK